MGVSARVVLGLVIGGGVGCGGRERAEPTSLAVSAVVLPSPATASAQAEPLLDPARWCGRIRRATQEAFDRATNGGRIGAPDGVVVERAQAPDWCVQSGRVTWALLVTVASYGPSASEAWGLNVDMIDVVVLLDGEVRLADTLVLGGRPDDYQRLEAIDFDGDRVAELTFLRVPEHPEGVTVSERYTFQAKPGARVTSYAFPGDTWTDADADGKLDGVSAAVTYDHTACWNERAFDRVPLLQHQLPDGTFSADDAVARAFAQKTCAARPKDLFVKSKQGVVDESKTAWRLECARLWGASMDEVDRALRAACPRTPRDDAACEETPPKDTCNFAPTLRAIAEATPPLLARTPAH